MRDITVLPSPYLEGTFDRLMKENQMKDGLLVGKQIGVVLFHVLIVIRSATASKVSRMDMDKLGKELLWFAKNKVRLLCL